jgi:succinoglycan biosynthesis protein ExoM
MSGKGNHRLLASSGDRPTAARPRSQEQQRALPQRLGRGVTVNYATILLTGVVTLVTTRILLDHLGASGYGVFALAGSVVAYLELLELGFGTATTKMMAEDVDRRNESVLRTLNTNVAVLMVLGAVAAVIGVSVSGYAVEWFNIPSNLEGQAHVAFAIMSVAIAISIPFDTLGGALTAYSRLDLLSLSNMVRALSAAIGGAIAAIAGGGVVAITTVGASCGIATHLLRWSMLRRLLPGLRLSLSLVDRSRLKVTSHLTGWFMLGDATSVVVERLDLVVVGVVLGVKAAAVYAIGLKLAQLVLRAVQPFTVLFFPRASGLSADADEAGLAALLIDGTRVSLAVAMPIVLGLTFLAPLTIKVWVGSNFHDAAGVLVFLAVARGLSALTETAWWILAGSGWVRWTSSLSVVEALVNLAASIILAHVMGPAGVALGTLIGVVVARLPMTFILARRASSVKPGDFVRGVLVPHAAPAAVTTLVLIAARHWMPASLVAVLAAAAGSFLLYGAVYLAVGGSEAERARIRTLASQLRRKPTLIMHPPSTASALAPGRATTSVAICVCTFQRPVGLARLLDALPAALPTGPLAGFGDLRIRVVVIDNEVRATTEAIVAGRAAGAAWPIDYVCELSRGISYARNTAVRTVTPGADFVAFIDDDEVPEPGWLAGLLAAQREADADVVMGPKDAVFDQPPPSWVSRGGFFRPREFADSQPLHWATTANVLIRSELFALATPPFSERLALAGGEDTMFFRRVHLAGNSIMWTNGARVLEYVGRNRTTARWLVMREYRKGNTLGACLVDLENSGQRRARTWARAAFSVTNGLVVLATAAVRGRVGLVRGAQRIAFGVGLVAGMRNHIYQEYADESRSELAPAAAAR